jgi:hypothetical protein
MSHLRISTPAAAGLLAPLALGLLLLPDAGSADSSAPVMCKDGTTAAQGIRAACSGHGGIEGSGSQASSSSLRASSAGSSSVPNMVGPNSGGEAGITGSPAGQSITETVRCKDGTLSPQGGSDACSGHGGIDRHNRATGEKAPVAGEAGPRRMASATSLSGSSAGATASAGAPPAMVWANAQSRVYYCPSDRSYGKTPQGKYMTETQAKSQGYQPDHNKPCD